MVPDEDMVTNFVPRRKYLEMADGSETLSVGYGDYGPFKMALVVPGLSEPLISVSAMDRCGYYVVFGGGKVKVLDGPAHSRSSRVIASGRRERNRLYYFDLDEKFTRREESLSTESEKPKKLRLRLPRGESANRIESSIEDYEEDMVASQRSEKDLKSKVRKLLSRLRSSRKKVREFEEGDHVKEDHPHRRESQERNDQDWYWSNPDAERDGATLPSKGTHGAPTTLSEFPAPQRGESRMVKRNDLLELLVNHGNKAKIQRQCADGGSESVVGSEIGDLDEEDDVEEDILSPERDQIRRDLEQVGDQGKSSLVENVYNHLGKVIDRADEQNRQLSLIHEATGMSKDSLVKLHKAGAVSNLPIKIRDRSRLDLENSELWYQTNLKESSHNSSVADSPSKQLLEVVGMDILAKFPKKSRHGNRYCFLFIDYSSRMLFPYFGVEKSDVTKATKQFKSAVVDPSKYQWKFLQSDSEKVLIEGKFKEFLVANSIGTRKSSPYIHSENGMVERAVGLVQDLARFLMKKTAVPGKYYEDAIRSACDTLNKFRLVPGSKITPFEMFSGRRPDYKKFVPFMSRGVAYVYKDERKGKLDLKGKAVLYLRPAEEYKNSYVVLDEKTKKEMMMSIGLKGTMRSRSSNECEGLLRLIFREISLMCYLLRIEGSG